MKKLITIIVLFISFSQHLYSQEYAVYSSNKQKTLLTVSPEKVLVWFVPTLPEERKRQILAKISINGLLPSDNYRPHTRVLSLKKGKTKEDAMKLVKDLLKEESVLYASPVLVSPEGISLGGLTNELIVKLKKTTSLTFLAQLATDKNIEKIESYEYDPLVYILTINKHSSTHTLDLSNQLLETGKFDFAHPNYHLFIKTATNDPYFNQQWNIKNTGQTVNGVAGIVGEDMKVEQAWNIATGTGIKVAVIDDGIQDNHPDLLGKVLVSDNVTTSTGTAPKKHGTAVAGVIAAKANNNEGIAGVAYNANLVSIRAVISGDAFATEAEVKWIASAIDRARVVHNVDIINISLECFFFDQTAFGIYENALNNAITLGRGGKGIPVFVSSGNSGSNDPNAIIFFNLLANYNQVIAVGASNNIGKRAGFSSFSGTSKMSVVAPGIAIPTTDLTGTEGYSSNPMFASGFLDDNYMRLSGTSFSCPNAAGVGALILSYNPNFTQVKVREIIETTADKVGGYSYNTTSGKPNGTWNIEMGYGRVNAYQALLKAQLCTFAPSSSLISVSGSGMTVSSSGLNLAVIYNGSFISSTPNSQNITQVEWQSLSSSVYVSQSGITATAYPTNGCVGGVANLRVRVKNVCNLWSDWRMFTVNVCSFSGFRFVYSPNPTSDVLAITAVPTEENKNLSLAAEIDFEVKLMDKDGRVVREGKNLNKEKKITLDVKGLKEGTYFLHIAHGKEVEKHQIVVSKSASTN